MSSTEESGEEKQVHCLHFWGHEACLLAESCDTPGAGDRYTGGKEVWKSLRGGVTEVERINSASDQAGLIAGVDVAITTCELPHKYPERIMGQIQFGGRKMCGFMGPEC